MNLHPTNRNNQVRQEAPELNPPLVSLHVATDSNLQELVALAQLTKLDIPEFRWTTPEWIAEEINLGNLFVARHQREAVGLLCFHTSRVEKAGSIELMAVRQDQQRLGVGRQIVKFAQELCRARGLEKLSVETFCAYGVTPFYEKCGFTKDGNVYHFREQPYYRLFNETKK